MSSIFPGVTEQSGSDHWNTNYKNDYIEQDVRFISPRYQPKEPKTSRATPRVTGRRHFPSKEGSNSTLNMGYTAAQEGVFNQAPSESSQYSSRSQSKYGTPLGSPRRGQKAPALQPPWGIQFRNVVPITLYQSSSSPSSAAVGMVARILGLRMNYVEVNTIDNEHLSERFLQNVNPAGTIPVTNDEGFKLFEFRAILRYLVNKYGFKNNTLYPEELMIRTRIESWLDFDLGTLSPAVSDFVRPSLVAASDHEVSAAERRDKLQNALEHVNASLQVSNFLCGLNMTIADISVVSSLVLLDSVRFDFGPHLSALNGWMLRMKGTRQFQDSFRSFYAIMGTLK